MSKNILGIISLMLAIAGLADASYYPDYYGMHKKYSINARPWVLHHKIPGMKVHMDYFDSDLSQYKNSLKLIQPLKPESIKHISLLKLTDYWQGLYNKPEISSDSKQAKIGSEQSVSDNSQSRNISTSKDSTESSNITTNMQKINGSAFALEVNLTESDDRQTADNQSLVSDTNATSIPSISSSENYLNSSVMNETLKLSTDGITDNSTAAYESMSTEDEEKQTSERETDGLETISEIASTSIEDATPTTVDFTGERTSKAYSTFNIKSTSLRNEVSLSTDSQKFPSASSFVSTEGSASSHIYTSPKPSVSRQVTDQITDRRYSVSVPKTDTPSSTEFPQNNILEQPEQVVELQGIRTLKIVVSVVFMVIAFVAGTVLIVFIFKVKRQEVQYDQLTLIP